MNQQSEGKITLGGIVFDMVKLVHDVLPHVQDEKAKAEIRNFLSGHGPLPSQNALNALEAAVISYVAQSKKQV